MIEVIRRTIVVLSDITCCDEGIKHGLPQIFNGFFINLEMWVFTIKHTMSLIFYTDV